MKQDGSNDGDSSGSGEHGGDHSDGEASTAATEQFEYNEDIDEAAVHQAAAQPFEATGQPANKREGLELCATAGEAPRGVLPEAQAQVQAPAQAQETVQEAKVAAERRCYPSVQEKAARRPQAERRKREERAAEEDAVAQRKPMGEVIEPAPVTEEAAVSQATPTAEGFVLESSNASGFKGVLINERWGERGGKQNKAFKVRVQRAGKQVHLGFFATAEEGALAYSRTPEAQAELARAKPVKPAPLTAEEAVAKAVAEGLTLQQNASKSGYKGVKLRIDSSSCKHEARVCRAGKQHHLGSFATAQEAALARARTPEAQAEVANAKLATTAPPTAEEVVAQATSEGLQLEPCNNASGFKRVTINVRRSTSRFEVRVRRGGNIVFFGSYNTAEEAALAYARTPYARTPEV